MEVPNKEEWMSSFRDIFAELSEKELPSQSFHSLQAIDPLEYSSKGVASFVCPKCRRYWESLNGKIKFTYRLMINSSRVAHGKVELKAFGQQCNQCPGSDWVYAKFASESIEDSLLKLLLKVKEKFYGENIQREYSEVCSRRRSVGRGKHDTSRCQACAEGVCSYGEANNFRPRHSYTGGSRAYSGEQFLL